MFNIGYVQKKTGLSSHVLRVWEKRHQAVVPERSDSNRRLYTPENLERLQLLARLTRGGHTISQIAPLTTEELISLNRQDQLPPTNITPITESQPSSPPPELVPLLTAIAHYDQPSLDQHLDRAMRDLGYSGLLEKIISPLMHAVGDYWHRGDFSTAQEHAATSFIKDYLSHRTRSFSPEPNAPVLLATTPSGQLHELGTYFATCHAAKLGWRTIYLGPSLPADEIAGAAIHSGASTILLGLQYPADDPLLPPELLRLRHQLRDQDTPILIGGNATKSYLPTLQKINATPITDFAHLTTTLTQIRETRP